MTCRPLDARLAQIPFEPTDRVTFVHSVVVVTDEHDWIRTIIIAAPDGFALPSTPEEIAARQAVTNERARRKYARQTPEARRKARDKANAKRGNRTNSLKVCRNCSGIGHTICTYQGVKPAPSMMAKIYERRKRKRKATR